MEKCYFRFKGKRGSLTSFRWGGGSCLRTEITKKARSTTRSQGGKKGEKAHAEGSGRVVKRFSGGIRKRASLTKGIAEKGGEKRQKGKETIPKLYILCGLEQKRATYNRSVPYEKKKKKNKSLAGRGKRGRGGWVGGLHFAVNPKKRLSHFHADSQGKKKEKKKRKRRPAGRGKQGKEKSHIEQMLRLPRNRPGSASS